MLFALFPVGEAQEFEIDIKTGIMENEFLLMYVAYVAIVFIGLVGRQYLKAIEIMFFDVFLYAGIPIGCVQFFDDSIPV